MFGKSLVIAAAAAFATGQTEEFMHVGPTYFRAFERAVNRQRRAKDYHAAGLNGPRAVARRRRQREAIEARKVVAA